MLARRPRLAGGLLVAFALLALAASLDGAHLLLVVDRPIGTWAVAHRSPLATALFRRLTFFGSSPATYGGGALLALLALPRCPRTAALVAVGTAVRPLVEYAVKLPVDRRRPDVDPNIVQHGPSFPSGHVLGSSMLFFLAATVFALYVSSRAWRRVAAVLGVLGVVLVGVSRVYLAYHWTTDVLGGLLGGALLTGGLDVLLRRWHAGRPCLPDAAGAPRATTEEVMTVASAGVR